MVCAGVRIQFHDKEKLGRAALVVFLAVALLGGSVGQLCAAAFSTKAKQAILMDYETGAILYQKDADALVPPASMSKLATLAVVFDRLKKGILKLEDTFVISEHAWRDGGAPSRTSAMFAPLGKPVSVEDLVQGIAIQSGNDASIAIAEGIAGSDTAFAKLMTQYMRGIGLNKSTFGNPTGLPHPDQLMTAREIALLAKHLISEYPDYYKYFGMQKFPYQPEGRRRPYAFFNRNPLLGALEGADGLKTGHLEESGYGLVGSALQNGQRLIAVVHGLESRTDRKNEAVKLMEWGFRSFSPHELYEPGVIIGKARVWGGENYYVPLRGEGTVKVLLPKIPLRQKLSAEIVYNAPLKPPIKEGQQVAFLRVTTASDAVNEVPLYAAEAVPEGTLVRKGLDSLLVMAWRWVADKASDLLERI
ncbi:MAG: D-alanyl-D-alanine carboxypeptidase [Alphaproteobacteria bacterium]|nr:D-alanyl-D-alanine carboxypeptidase [Alphaproteobacteria bacterium]